MMIQWVNGLLCDMEGRQLCAVKNGGWTCTELFDHTEDHVALSTTGVECSRWPQPPAPIDVIVAGLLSMEKELR